MNENTQKIIIYAIAIIVVVAVFSTILKFLLHILLPMVILGVIAYAVYRFLIRR